MSRISGNNFATPAIMCRNFTLSLHPQQWLPPDFGQTFAPRVMLCLRFGTDFWKNEVITLIFQTDLSSSGTRCPQNHSYHRKTKMNCPEIQTDHAVSRIICSRFQACRDDRDLQLSRKSATHHEPRHFPITNQLTQIT